jgi:hypothetical protein
MKGTDLNGNPSTQPPFNESTRLRVVGASEVQATYDFRKWLELLKIGGIPAPIKQEIDKRALEFYGLPPGGNLSSVEDKVKSLDFLRHMSSDDPPMRISNRGPSHISDLGDVEHHPLHAKVLWEKARKLRLEARVYAPQVDLTAPCEDMVDFLLWHLLDEPDLCFHHEPEE